MNIWNVFSEPTLVIIHTLLCEYLLAGIFFLGSYLSSLYSTFTLSPAALYGTTASSSSFSLEHAAYSFQSYSAVAASETNGYRSKFNTLRGAHRRLAVEIGYSAKIEMLKEASIANSSVTRAIYDLARAEFPCLNTSMTSARARGMKQDIGRVRESLKHLVRDWGSEGARERDVIFAPILAELSKIPPERRSGHRVLVPGAGLGRLAWEIASMGQ
jgi:N2227-like protein